MPRDEHGRRTPAEGAPPGQRDTGGAFQLLLAANPLPMWVFDLETLRFLEVNDAAVAHYGYSRAEFLAMAIEDIRPAEDVDRMHEAVARHGEGLRSSGAWRHRRADGTLIEVELTTHRLEWEGRPAVLVVAHDVTETRRLQAELARRALYDEPTGLANAALFSDRVTAALASPRANGRQLGVLAVGLGALEQVAATAGGPAADAMVAVTGRRLSGCCGPEELPAHLGGGRFGVLAEAKDERAILQLASSIVSALSKPVAVAGWGELKGAPSVGIALADGQVANTASLIRDATSAMHHAAERDGGHFVLFNAELRVAALEAFETERVLEGAARLGQLRLHYQPVVDLRSGEVVACESLLRWERPGFGLVGPDRFIPIAERSELIVELGAWVIDQAIAEAATWPTRTGSEPRVSVNLSARQLRDERLAERFASACARSGLAPSSVCAELTESAFVATDDYGAYRVLAGLRETGIEVAIDDFGTGYSSLAYLKHLPVDVIKVDRGFVAGLGIDRTDALLVEAAVGVAHGLGLRVVAEGVETEAQLEVLRDLGCDGAQGYLFARPVTASEMAPSIDRARHAAAR